MIRLFRNVFRRKLRAFLTIFGITIGVFALVVMGAMAEKLNLLVAGGVEYYQDKVLVSSDSSNFITSAPLSMSTLRDIRHVEGVDGAFAQVGLFLEEEIDAVNMGTPPTVQGEDLGTGRYESFVLEIAEGRGIQPGDRGVVVLGADLPKQLETRLGRTIEIRDHEFQVVGIYDKTLTAPDTSAQVSLEDAQMLYKESLPEALRGGLNEKNIATSFVVYPKAGIDPDQLGKKIDRQVIGVASTGPKAFQEQVVEQLAIFTQIIFGIGAISLLVGGLSVVNTMSMSVAERTREIGIRKAIGASNGQIMRQFIGEAAVIGFIGGFLGLGVGWLIAQGLNALGEASGNQLFLVTPNLAVQSVLFAIILGVVSGLYPAYHAAQMNPVQALRYE